MRAKIRLFAGGLAVLAILVLSPIVLQGTHQESSSSMQTGRGHSTVGQNQVITRNLSSIPLPFTENRGQWDERVLFRADAGSATIWFTNEGVYHQFVHPVSQENGTRDYSAGDRLQGINSHDDSICYQVVKISFVNAAPNLNAIGKDELEYRCNYFLGNDPAKWCTGVPNYRTVCYKDIYLGIDLEYYVRSGKLEYDFIVSPGADPEQIRIRYEGAESISIDDYGDLSIQTVFNEITESAPRVYQRGDDIYQSAPGKFILLGNNEFGFKVAGGSLPGSPLVIDPVVNYSTYLGGNADDIGTDVYVDAAGCAYITGTTQSLNFPTTDALIDTLSGSTDVFVTKINGEGNNMIWSTYIGGSGYDGGWFGLMAFALDDDGNIYLTGSTGSSDFPLQNPIDSVLDDNEAFVAKLAPDGQALIYSTFLGGDVDEIGMDITIDTSRSVYVTGLTTSPNFPTVNAFDDSFEGCELCYMGFISKLSSDGDSLEYSTYIGGYKSDMPAGIVVDKSGAAFVTGRAESPNFPAVGTVHDTHSGIADAFLAKLSSDGSSLPYCAIIGGWANDEGIGITIDSAGNAVISGYTISDDFPTSPGAYDQVIGNPGGDGFVIKWSIDGDSLVWGTFIGGDSDDYLRRMTLDDDQNVYVAGMSQSDNYPEHDPLFGGGFNGGYRDAVVTVLSADGSSLLFSTYLGGEGKDEGWSVDIDALGNIYIVGYTRSQKFQVVGCPHDDSYNGASSDIFWGDAFVSKISFDPASCSCPDFCDINRDGMINPVDVVLIIRYVYLVGDPPSCIMACGGQNGDWNCDGIINPVDAVLIINKVYILGEGPCDPCAQ